MCEVVKCSRCETEPRPVRQDGELLLVCLCSGMEDGFRPASISFESLMPAVWEME